MLPKIANERVGEAEACLPRALFGSKDREHGIDHPELELGYSKQTRWVLEWNHEKEKRAYCFCSCWLGRVVSVESLSTMKLEVRIPSMDEVVRETWKPSSSEIKMYTRSTGGTK